MTSAIPAAVETDAPDVPDLIARSRAGDPDAFCRLYRMFAARLLRQANALCGNPTLAEDLSQEVFLQARKSLHRYNGHCQFFTWLCAILLHRCRSSLRRRWPLPFSNLATAEREHVQGRLDNLADPHIRPDESTQIAERAALLLGCVQRLPKRHREVLYLRFYVEDSLESIAAALGCSVATAKSRLFHGLEKLRKMRGLTADLEEGS